MLILNHHADIGALKRWKVVCVIGCTRCILNHHADIGALKQHSHIL